MLLHPGPSLGPSAPLSDADPWAFKLGQLSKGGKAGSKGGGKGKGGKGYSGGEVNLSYRHLGDTQLAAWCRRYETGSTSHFICLNISQNEISDAGCKSLVQFLTDACVPLRVLKLYANHLGDGAAHALAGYIRGSKHPVAEIHLSHNFIQRDGAAALLEAAAEASDSSGGARYPSFDLVSKVRPVPLWLRLEHNLLDMMAPGQPGVAQFVRAPSCACAGKGGFLVAAPEPPPQMLCEAFDGMGCSSHSCSQVGNGGPQGTPGGPVVHVPHIKRQRRPQEGPLPAHRPVARAGIGARPTALAADDDASSGPKPAAQLPRARSPVRFNIGEDDEDKKSDSTEKPEQLPILPCAYKDFRLREGPAVGQHWRICRAVTSEEAIAEGNAPENYLVDVAVGDEIEILHIEGTWVWARCTLLGKECLSGWLASDALAPQGKQGGG
eukprot:CAMPEP_0168416510 /NCGR_PEP_ID=MMETSP0228-20121227/30775_1 /TAXON_ID=133427 /ORGANISM="Protoceratium reticulatum, Strain CCCM 535 (=CCMP 1889)" /LENGTH=437 /DNA_ID=CAMNT_0008430333 /DNA_START=36 /DNA_END=1348 /DNA_ORIENTATION=+